MQSPPSPRRRPRLRSRAAGGRSWLAQDVARATHGVDEPLLLVALRLAPAVADVDVERIGRVSEVVAQDPFVDERAREHLPWIAHEELEQVSLCRCQLEPA